MSEQYLIELQLVEVNEMIKIWQQQRRDYSSKVSEARKKLKLLAKQKRSLKKELRELKEAKK